MSAVNVLLMTKGTGGDIYPFIRLARSLVTRGHNVALLTHQYFQEDVTRAGIDFLPLDAYQGSERRVFHNPILTNTKSLLAATRTNIKADLIRETELIEKHCESANSVLITHENLHLTARTAAEKLNIPLGLVFLSPSSVLTLPFLAEQFDILSDDINQIRLQIGLAPVNDWQAWTRAGNLALGFWPEWFTARDPKWLLDVIPVGFMLDSGNETLEIPERLRNILLDGERPTLISHGTSVPHAAEFFAASVEACRLSGKRGILITRFPSEVPARLPACVELFDSLPFASIMPAMEAVIHHGGIGTSAQALAAGIPQVVLAFGYDRPYNAVCLESLGVGAHLPPVKWHAALIAESLAQLSASAYVLERCQDLSERSAASGSTELACQLIEDLALSKYQPPKLSESLFPQSDPATLSAAESPTTSNIRELVDKLSPEKRALLASRLRRKVSNQFEKRTIAPRRNAGPAPLSFAQQRMWLLDQLMPGNPSYNLVSAVRLTGPFNAAALKQALREIVRRHEVLRTVFTELAGQPMQVVSATGHVSMPIVDLRESPQAQRESWMRRILAESAQCSFDLKSGPLLKVVLLRLEDHQHVVSFTMHHVIGDGWSTDILNHEVTVLYQAFSQGKSSPLPELPIQYADFAVWQREWLSAEVLEEQLSYWKKQLSGVLPTFELQRHRAPATTRSFRGASPWFLISKSLSEQIKTFSQQLETTLFMTLLTAFKIVMSIYSDKIDIVVGTPNANRSRAELAGLIGVFANVLVLRTDLSGDPTFVEMLGRVKATANGAYAHQEMPFEKLVEALHPNRSLDRTPLFQVAFTLQSRADGPDDVAGLKIEPVFCEIETAAYDIVLVVDDAKRGLGGVFNYSVDLFEAGTISQMSQGYEIVLESMVNNSGLKLSALKQIVIEAVRQRAITRGTEFEASSLEKLKSTKRKPLSVLPAKDRTAGLETAPSL